MTVEITYKTAGGTEKLVEYDAVLEVFHDFGLDITEHPVMGERNVADHARARNEVVQVQIFVTNMTANANVVVESVVVPTSNGQQHVVSRYAEEFERPSQVFQDLREAVNSKALVSIITKMHKYSNMLIERVGAPEDASNGVMFMVDFRHVRIVDTQTVVRAGNRRSQKKRHSGRQATKEVDKKTKEKVKEKPSFITNLIKAAGE